MNIEGYLYSYCSYCIFCKKYPCTGGDRGYWKYEVCVDIDDILRKRNKVHVFAHGQPLAETGVFFSGDYDTSTGKITYKSYYDNMTELNPRYGFPIPPEDELLNYFLSKVKEFMNKLKDPNFFIEFNRIVTEARRKKYPPKKTKKEKTKEEKPKQEKPQIKTEEDKTEKKSSSWFWLFAGATILYLLIKRR